ncbi:MAG: TA system VapC family ribonuclease toxin [Solirubrobacterales bacterium]
MKLVDTNVLIYAVDPLTEHHQRSRRWLDGEISSGRKVLIPWVALIGFLRLTTNPSTAVDPLKFEEAAGIVKLWISRPNVSSPHPDASHLERMRELLLPTSTGGNLVNDAHLAALALQHNAVVMTFDNDFSRFPGVRWESP